MMDNQTNTMFMLLSTNDSYTYSPENMTEDFSNVSAAIPTIDPATQERCDLFDVIINKGLIGTLCVLGIIGNTISILVLQKDKHNQVAVFLLQALAFADNSVLGLFFLNIVLLSGFQPKIYDHARRALPYLIKYVTPVVYMTLCTAIWITTLLAINRFIAVCRPFLAPNLLTLRKAKIHVALVVLLSVIFNIPRFFQYEIIEGEDGYLNVRSTSIGRHTTFGIIYSLALYTIIVLIFPLLILICLNFKIIMAIRASRLNMRKNSLPINSSNSNSDNITLIMVIVVLVFLVCHTPDRIFIIASAYYSNVVSKNQPACPHSLWYALRICNLLVILNSATNFIIYYLCRGNFRMILKQKLQSILGKGKRGAEGGQFADREQTAALAFADNSILGITFMMLVLLSGLQPVLYVHARRALPYLIKFVVPIAYMVHSTAIWITTLLAINRFIAVCRPFTAPNLLTLKRAKIHVALVVLLSVIFNVPRFFQYDIIEGKDGFLDVRSTSIGQHTTFGIIYSNALYTLIVLIFPLLILICLNVKIILAIRTSRQNMRKNSLQSGSPKPKSDNITLIMVIIVLVFLVCHTPDRIFLIVNAYYINVVAKNQDIEAECPHQLWYALRICNLLITLNSATNFIIYYFCRGNFRMILKQKCQWCIWERRGVEGSQSGDKEQTGFSLLHMNGNLQANNGH